MTALACSVHCCCCGEGASISLVPKRAQLHFRSAGALGALCSPGSSTFWVAPHAVCGGTRPSKSPPMMCQKDEGACSVGAPAFGNLFRLTTCRRLAAGCSGPGKSPAVAAAKVASSDHARLAQPRARVPRPSSAASGMGCHPKFRATSMRYFSSERNQCGGTSRNPPLWVPRNFVLAAGLEHHQGPASQLTRHWTTRGPNTREHKSRLGVRTYTHPPPDWHRYG